ncbi:sodium:proton exchanger [Thalassotalea mangrovi]|uniref:Sodium:proton exchanger n=2 Tax=Thalassotalea mangrovi TaxID=2572245 RepID=A0A4U1B5B4_9GAMM|nr:sodium:proton exchanger [Thalassotalea mangrovi]
MHPPELLVLGGLLLCGWVAHRLGGILHVPRVTLLLMLGILAGPSAFNIIPEDVAQLFPQVTHLALAMVGFLLGESLAGRDIKKSGAKVLTISIGETLGAAVLVFICVVLFTQDIILALLLAGIAPASAPAAILDVVREHRAKGPLTSTVLGVVAIDDAWGVIIFSLLLVIAEVMLGESTGFAELALGLWDVGGAILLGIGCGIPMAFFTGRLKKGEPSILEASGFVFITGGLALYLQVSYILACIVLGATVALRAKHHIRPFREIEGASEPFLVIFFLLAGYKCEIDLLTTIGLLGIVYIFARSAGLIIGGGFGARISGSSPQIQTKVGWCLLPQAGVALGLALLASERLPAYSEIILPLIVSTTVVFEIAGPLITQLQLKRSGEIR